MRTANGFRLGAGPTQVILLVLIVPMICLSAGTPLIAQDRPTISLDGEWSLAVRGKGVHTVTVPGCWQAQVEELRNYPGPATYTRRVFVPESWRGRRIAVRFGAVDYLADVYINSTKVGSHEGGYLPFEFDIQRYLKLGQENEIAVRVSDAGPQEVVGSVRYNEIPHGKQSAIYGFCSGLWQSACLEARNPEHIDRIVVDPDVDKQVARVRVERVGSTACSVRIRVAAPKGAVAVPEALLQLDPGQHQAEIEVKIASPMLWSHIG